MCFNRFMNEMPKPPHENEEDASKTYEKLKAIRQNQKESGSELNQTFLPDPAVETGAESLGGGYETAPPPKPPTPKYIADQLPDESHKEAARKGIPAARKALEDARNRNNSIPPSNPNTP